MLGVPRVAPLPESGQRPRGHKGEFFGTPGLGVPGAPASGLGGDFALGDSALHAERLTETGGSRHATHCTPASVTRRGACGSAEKMDLNGPRHKETNAVRGVN